MPPRPLRRNPPRTRLRLEKTPDPAGLERAVGDLIEWLQDPQQASPRRAFTVWIKRVLIPGRLPGVVQPELGNLMEIKTMLAESVIEWTEQWKQPGRQKGRLEGKLEGELVLLERQLGKRFGPLTEETRARLRKATTEQLETWADRVLEAKTLDDVLGAP